MKGDYSKAKVGDFVRYHGKCSGDADGFYMILKKTEGHFILIKICDVDLGNFYRRDFVMTYDISADSDNLSLIKRDDIMKKFKNSYNIKDNIQF